MAAGRHYRLRFVDQSVDNIHLRIANDVYLFIQRTHELGTGLLGSVVAIASFAYILWGVSAIAPLPLFGMNFAFPGYLIWFAILYAGIGTFIAHLVGQPLIALNFKQQRYESDFRFAIARVTDHAEGVALMRGEPVEREELGRRFNALVRNWTALINRQTKLNGFIFGYAHVSTVVPILVVSPAFLAGAIPLGTLIQSSHAFQRVEGAFAFCLSSYSRIAEWNAVMERLAQFEHAMAVVDRPGLAGAEIDIAHSPGEGLAIRDLVVRLAGGEEVVALKQAQLAPGDRLLITGASGAGKSCLFKALAGLWPIGEGQVSLPKDGRVLTLPQRPYFPLGTLRQALTYPTVAGAVSEPDIREALAAVGLGHLVDRLDEEAEWGTVLSGGEQQRIGFARMLINRPGVLLLDEAVAMLEENEARDLYEVLAERLPTTIIISVGRSSALAGLHRRTIALNAAPAATRGRPALAVVPA
jgi:putative ATP-binding cassette transporter